MENMERIDCGSEPTSEVTILDVLQVHLCRDAILDYVHIRDIVRSERVCRQWQQAVLDYLPRCRNVSLSIYQRSRVYKHSHRTIMIRDDGTYPVHDILEKLGPIIVNLYTNRSDKEFYEDIASYCLRLKQIELKHLRQRGSNISEHKLGRAFQNIALEKVKLVRCTTLTGKFLHLMNLNNLRSFSLTRVTCCNLKNRHLKCNAPRLHNVRDLEIMAHFTNCKKGDILINNMPNVESIVLKGVFEEGSKKFAERCKQFYNLKRLDIRENCVDDEFLEILAKGCKKLEYLNIAGSINSPCGQGLTALVLRPSRGISLCFTRIKSESLELLLEFLQPFSDVLEYRGRKKITLEMLNEAFKLKGQYDPLELRLLYPAPRNANFFPELKIVLNVSFERPIFAEIRENPNPEEWAADVMDVPEWVEIEG